MPNAVTSAMAYAIQAKADQLKKLAEEGKIRSLEGGEEGGESFLAGGAGHILFEKLFPTAQEAALEEAKGLDYHLSPSPYTADAKCQTQNVADLRDYFEGKVPAYSEKYITADFLVFFRINLANMQSWNIAYIKTQDYFKGAAFYPAGTKLPHMPRPFKVDMRRMLYIKMNPISELKEIVNRV
jgi:hypothetical protein